MSLGRSGIVVLRGMPARETQGLLHSSWARRDHMEFESPGEKRPRVSPQPSCFLEGLLGAGDTAPSW